MPRTSFAVLVIVLKDICEGVADVELVITLIICIGYVIVAPLLIHGANKVAFKKKSNFIVWIFLHAKPPKKLSYIFHYSLGKARPYATLDHSGHHLYDLGSDQSDLRCDHPQLDSCSLWTPWLHPSHLLLRCRLVVQVFAHLLNKLEVLKDHIEYKWYPRS